MTRTLALKQHLPLERMATYALSTTEVYLKLPSLWVKDNCFYCDGEAMVFHHASRRLALLKAFLAGHGHQLSREQILTLVYGENQLARRSPRYAACLAMNVLRMVSDTRRQLYVAYASRYPGIDWLYFNKGEKKWKLARLRDDYVLMYLNARVFAPPSPGEPPTRYSGWH